MRTLLKPRRLDLYPNSLSAAKEWKHWLQTLTTFIGECGENAPDKYRTLANYISHNLYELFEVCSDYMSHLLKHFIVCIDLYHACLSQLKIDISAI